jgi:hypothetical protein
MSPNKSIALLLTAAAAAQSPLLMQQVTNSGTDLADLTVVLTYMPQPGDLMVVCTDSTSGGSSSLSGGGVSQWTLCQTSLPTQGNSEIWAGIVDAEPNPFILVTLGGSPNCAAAEVTEWRGFVPPLAFAGDFTSGLGGTSGAPATSGSVAANAGDLVIAMIGTHSTGQLISAPTNGFVDLDRPFPQPSCVMAAAARIADTAGPFGTSWTFPSPSVYACATVVFRAAHPGTFGGSGDDIASQIRIDPANGNWIVAGTTTSFGRANDILLARFDANGNLLTATSWGGMLDEELRGMDLHSGTARGIYLTGASNSFGAGDRDIVLVRYDLDGNLEWGARWSTVNGYDEHGEAVCVDDAGSAYVVGTYHTPEQQDDLVLLKFAPVPGAQLPVAPLVAAWGDSAGDERANAAVFAGTAVDPRLYVVGSTTSFGNGGRDMLVQRYNDSLELQWTRTWGGTGDEEGAAAAVDAQGNLYVAGSTADNAPPDALLTKWDSDGNLLWSVTFGGADADSLRAVLVDCYGNVVVTGVTASVVPGEQDGLLAKFDADGNLLWAQTWGGAPQSELCGTAIAACADLIVAGSSTVNPSLGLWTVPNVQRSTSTDPVTSPAAPLNASPDQQLDLPVLPQAGGPGIAQGRDIWLQRVTGATAAIAPGCPAATGGPDMAFENAPVIGGAVRIWRTTATPAPLTVLVLGTQGPPMPLSVYGATAPGATLCLQPVTGPLFFVGSSPTVFQLSLQPLPILQGTPLDLQWIDVPGLATSVIGHLRAGW